MIAVYVRSKFYGDWLCIGRFNSMADAQGRKQKFMAKHRLVSPENIKIKVEL